MKICFGFIRLSSVIFGILFLVSVGHSQITLTGDLVICDGIGTTLTADAEGAVAYIWSTGENTRTVFIRNGGTYTVSVTYANGNAASRNFTIRDSRDIEVLAMDICDKSTAQITPVLNFGKWASNSPDIAVISPQGLITPKKPGKATFAFQYNQSACLAESDTFTIHALPVLSTSKTSACIGDEIQLSPSSGGTWSVSDNQKASVTNAGFVNTKESGTLSFIYSDAVTGCSSVLDSVIVFPKPSVDIVGRDTICVGYTTQLKPSFGGTWQTVISPVFVATVANSGLVTGIQPGSASFVYHQASTGCTSDPTPLVHVVNPPEITTDIPRVLCLGGDKQQIITEKSGFWQSANPAIAMINNQGEITPLAPGNVQFVFTSPSYACPARPVECTIAKVIPVISSGIVQQNRFIDLGADASGTWTSLQPEILRVSNNQKAIGYKPGPAKLEFVSDSGCYASFGVEVKAGKMGSNADIDLSGFKNNDFNGFSAFDTDLRMTGNHTGSSIIYPNPATETLNIAPGHYQILRIYHVSGKLMCEIYPNDREINIQHWAPGVYNATFYNGQEMVNKLFVKL